MSSDNPVRSRFARAARQCLPWVLALAVATCTDDSTGPSRGGVGYFSFRPVYSGISSSLSQFGIVADSVHIRLTRPVDEVVLDTTVFFPPDSASISLALPVALEVSPEVLSAMIEIKAGATVLFVDTVEVSVVDGPPGSTPPATATLEYIGPGNNIASITVFPADTTIFFGDTLFYTSTAVDSAALPVINYYVGWKTSDTNKVNSQGRLIAPASRGTIQVIGYTPTGIEDTATVTFAPVPSQLLADSGAAQVGLVNDSLPSLFVARVMAADAQPVEGIGVRFTAVTAGGAVRDTLLLSDANGRVRTRGVFGTATGAYTWTATIVGTAISANFTGTAGAGAPSIIAVQSGNAQVDSAGRTLPLPLTARVSDAFNNPVPGVKVYWTRKAGAGTVAADSSLTNASGLAATGYTLGAVGIDSVEAKIAGTSAAVLFHATSINGAPATMAVVLGNAQSDTVGQPVTDSLAVTVASATAFPVAGTPVVWTVLRGGAVTSDTTLTDATGRAAVGYTLGTLAGIDSVRAQAGGASATFTATALAGAPTALAVVSGDAQADTVGFVLPNPFIVRAADAFDNPVTGAKVYWNVVSGSGTLSLDSSFTNGSGQAFTGYTLGALPGTDSISATLECSCASVTFTVTTLAAAPASIAVASGDGQTAVVATPFADSLVVTVLDANSDPVAGTGVEWLVIGGGGTLDVDTVLTDANGQARALYTADTMAGPANILARTVIGAHGASFTLTEVPDAPAILAIVGGNNQTDTLLTAIDVGLEVGVADQYGNFIVGAQVAYERIAGTGTLFADTVATGGGGEVAVGYLLGGTPGVDTIRVTLVGTGATVDFLVNVIAGVPVSLDEVAGDLQSDTARSVLATPMQLRVLDARGNPVPGAEVTFAGTGGLTTLPAVDTADLNGAVSAVVTLGDSAGSWQVTATVAGVPVATSYDFTTSAGVAAGIEIASGNGQADTAGRTLPLPLVARVIDAYGNPVTSETVGFTRIAGSGFIVADTQPSDGNGLVTTNYQLGSTPGVDSIRATHVATGTFVDFTATTLAGAPTSIAFVGGVGQTDTVARTLDDSLMVLVLDTDNAPLGGVPVVWSTRRGGTPSADTTLTDSLGHAWVTITLSTAAGTDTVDATVAGTAVATYASVYALPDAPSAIAIVSGDAQADTAGRTLPNPLVVLVSDAYGNPVPSASVVPTVTAGGGLVSPFDTAFTAADGTTSFGLTLGAVAGPNALRATIAGTSAFVDFSATGVTAAAGSVIAHAGYGQSDTVGFTLTDSLKVHALDISASPLVSAPVVWTVVRGGAVAAETTYTDSLGYSATAYSLGTVAGEDSVEARVVGSAPVALFTATALPGSGVSIGIVSGDAQVDTIGTTLPAPLMALVTDGYGNPSPYQYVAFSVFNGTGTLTSDTVQTDGTGRASVFYTLGSVPATDLVRATLVANDAFVDFSATAIAGIPTSLIAYSGDGQFDTVMSTLADSLVVVLRDASSRPVAGVWLYWQGSDVAVDSDSTLTDSLGRAAVQATFGAIATPAAAVFVRNADTSLTTSFSLAAYAGAPFAMSYIDGDAQSGVVNTTLPTEFTFQAFDVWGNSVPNVPVAYVRLSGSGFFTPDTAYTDSLGVARSSYTLGSVIGTDSLSVRLVGTASEFTLYAVGDAGAAAAMAYVSGTGQSDTVARALPTPFTVNVTDIGGNPRSNVWVRFTKTAASGVLSADSILTDASGVAQVNYTLGQVTGYDSVLATLEGLTDTVTFYAFAENEVGTQLLVFSGDSGGAGVGTPTGLPVVFIVRDPFGNPVGDRSVSFSAAPGSSSPQISEATTGDDGLASAGFWTVDAAPGYNTLTATSGLLTATATAIGLPIGTTNMWTGASSSDWNSVANWMGGVVPDINDTVFIPAGTPFAPVLASSVNVGRLVVAGAVTIDLGTHDLISSNGIEGSAAVFTATTGLVNIHGGTWDATATNLQVDSTVLGTGSVTGDLTVAGPDGLKMNGHTLAVPGNVTLFGPLHMGSGTDSLDIGGDLTVEFTDMGGATAAGTIVLRGDFVGNSLFRPVGSNTVVLAGADSQQVSFSDWSSSWFNTLVVNNPTAVEFQSNVQIMAGMTQVAGQIWGSVNTFVTGGLVVAADSAWNPGTTTLAGTSFIAPDTMFGNVSLEYSTPTTLPGDFTVLGDLYVGTQGTVTFGPSSVHVTGQLIQVTADAGLVIEASSSILEVGGLFAVGANTNSFADGTLILHGGIQQYGGAVFRPASTFLTRFVGTSGQVVDFATPGPGLAQSSFGPVEIADSVDLASNAWFRGDVSMQAGGKLTSATASINGDLVGSTWDNWRPGATVFEATVTTLPDSIYGDLQLLPSFTLDKALTIGGNFQFPSSSSELTLNGWPLTVGGDFSTDGLVHMESAADSLDVGGSITWQSPSSLGILTDGVIIVRGDFTSISGGPSFQPTAAHRTVFEGSSPHLVRIAAPGSVFANLELRGTGGIQLTDLPMQVHGALTESQGSVLTVTGNQGLEAYGPVSLDGVVFDSTGLTIDTDLPVALHALTFRNRPDANSLQLGLPGGELPTVYSDFVFEDTAKQEGAEFVSAYDRTSNGYDVTIHMVASTPLDGSAHTDAQAGNDGTSVLWSHQEFQLQPLGGQAGSLLGGVEVRVVGPDGVLLNGFGGDVTLAIGNNPGNGTLFGTTTATAVSGVATFSDLLIDSVGSGYNFTATAAGLEPVTSDDFDITVPLPVGFTTAWVGGVSGDWNDPANWSTASVPDDSANVFISLPYANAPVSTSTVQIGSLQVAPGATLQVASSVFMAAGNVEAFGVISGAGSFQPNGAGFLTGEIQAQTVASGSYSVNGTLRVSPEFSTAGDVLVSGGDSLIVTGLFGTLAGTGRLIQNDPASVVIVDGDASFDGGSTTGQLTDGQLHVSGALGVTGSVLDAFAPSAPHTTILSGNGIQPVYFSNPDTANGSHFGNLQASTNGHARMDSPTWVTGNLLVTVGTTFEDTLGYGVAVLGLTTVDSGGTIYASRLAMSGVLDVAVGGSYSVPLTVYFGDGAPLPIRAAPYDTLMISREATPFEDLALTGDLRINDGSGVPAIFDVSSDSVFVAGDVLINGNGTLKMKDLGGFLGVTGSFYTNGASTAGNLTNGWLRIGGSFHQFGDGSPEGFRAAPGHTTEFYFGGPTTRSIEFDSPSGGPSDPNGSHFGALLLPIGYDTLVGRVPAAGPMFIAADVFQDTTQLANVLAAYDKVTISTASPSVRLRTLEVWDSLDVEAGAPYIVVNTRIMGGGGDSLPLLPYQNLLISNAAFTLAGDLSVKDLDLGTYCGEGGECSTPGSLTVGGNTIVIFGDLNVMGAGRLIMAAGDSVDVGGTNQWRTLPNDGDLTGGTLVVRGTFITTGSSTFQASHDHRTIFAAPGVAELYPTANMRFGTLELRDNGMRRVRSSEAVVVLDTLFLSATGAGISDTFGFGTGNIRVAGPVVTVSGSEIYMEGSVRFDNDTILVAGGYLANQTIFGGPNTEIPALPYRNITVLGNARLADSIDVTGYTVSVGDATGGSLDLESFTLHTGDFQTGGLGYFTMDLPSAQLVVEGDATFAGGGTAGTLTNGTATFKGNFTQSAANDSASYFAVGSHTTVFADSGFGGSAAIIESMSPTTSRFNNVTITGTGVTFYGATWIGADVAIVSPSMDSVGGSFATIGGGLTDPNYKWMVDSTRFMADHPAIPDSINGTVEFEGAVDLAGLQRIGGSLTIHDTMAVAGFTLFVGGDFAAVEGGLLQMIDGTDDVHIGGNALFNGANATGEMTGGNLRIFGDLTVGPDSAFSFDATGTHKTWFTNGIGGSTVTFAAGVASGFQNVEYYNSGLTLGSDILVRGDLSSTGETAGPVYGGAHYVQFGDASSVEQGVEFNNTRVRIPQSVTLFDLDFTNQDPDSTQIYVVGAGSPEALQLGNIRFSTIPTGGRLVYAIDTLANGDSLVVQMMSSTPFMPVAFGAGLGEGRVDWGHLEVTQFPVTVDSLVPFTVQVTMVNPNGGLAGLGGNATISLATNPGGAVLGGTLTRGTSFSAFTFDDLTFDRAATGISFFVAIDGQPTDTVTTGLLDVINPAPLGSIAWDGEGGDGLWNTAANWVGDVIPGAGDSAFVGGGTSIIVSDSGFSIGGLVLGQGASLSIDPVASLSITGRLTAGNTIYGSGSLILAGTAMPVSGAINAPTTINGTVTTVGQVTFGNDLVVDGPGAELNVGGATVTVNGVFSTANGGILTMDGATDSLIVNEAGFNGGSTATSLTAGTLIITGADFSQAGPSPSAFAPSGSHLTIFEDAGDNSNASFNDPDDSYFANLEVRTPNSLLLNAPTGRALVGGDLTLDGDGALTGDTLGVSGHVVMGEDANLTLGQLSIGGNGNLIQANYNVPLTRFDGSGQDIPGVFYQALELTGTGQFLTGDIFGTLVTSNSSPVDIGGYTLTADSLIAVGGGGWIMDSTADVVRVQYFARFAGSTAPLLTNGLLEIFGDLQIGDGAPYFNASAAHTTRFALAATYNLDLPGEIEAAFGTLIVNDGTALIEEDFTVNGDLVLNDGAVRNNNDGGPVLTVFGDITADAGANTSLEFDEVNAYAGFSFLGTPSNFDVPVLRMWGNGVTLQSGFPYRTLMVLGTATLGGPTAAQWLLVDGSGDLLMGGDTLTVDSLIVNSNAHLRMQDPADHLEAAGWVMFQGDSSEGDYTAGTIRAAKFVQTTGPSGDPRSFVQTGTNRIVPLHQDTIDFAATGPAGSRLRSLVLDSSSMTLNVMGSLWIDDSLAITGTGTGISGAPGAEVVVGQAGSNVGTIIIVPGSGVFLDVLAIGGTLDVSGGYNVGLTKFIGSSQAIPTGPNYFDIEVQYSAYLTGPLTLPAEAVFSVGNFGDLALAGNILTVDTFRTTGFGVLRMQNALDTLRTAAAYFGGGSTEGTLTHGGIETGMLFQTSSTDSASFAPSGIHTTTFLNIGGFSESGRDFSFETPSASQSHFAHVNFTGTDGVNALSDVYVTGTTYINNTFQGLGHTLTGVGQVDIGPGATVELDTLRLLDTIIIDPSAGYNVGLTVFGPGAAPMPASFPYGHVGVEGVQTLTGNVDLAGNLLLMKAGELHLGGNKITLGNDFAMYDSARLVMSSPADTLQAFNAYFFGDSTAGDLSGGTIALQGGMLQSDSMSTKSFRPTGTKVRFISNGLAFVTFESPDSANGSYLGDAFIDGATIINVQTGIVTTGLLQIDTAATFQFNTGLIGSDSITHWGPVIVLPGGSYVNGSSATSTFHAVPSVLGGFTVQYAQLDGVPVIPNLPWNVLEVRNGGSIVLSGDLSVNYLAFGADAPGGQDVALNGYNVATNGFATNGYATITMNGGADTLVVNGYANFNGGSTDGKLTNGVIQVGQGLLQDGSNSPSSFKSTGTVVEFTNTGLQASIQLSNPDSSSFAAIRAQSSNQLWLRFNTNTIIKGTMSGYSMNLEANPSTLIDVDTVSAGPGGASIILPALRTKALLGSASTYDVDRTEITGVGIIPNRTYDTLIVQAKNAAPSGFTSTHLSVNDTLTIAYGTIAYAFGDVVVAGAEGFLQIDGGDMEVYGDFITTAGALFSMDSVTAKLTVMGDADIQGGASFGNLTLGLMEIHGDFNQGGDPFSFVADAGHTTLFTGGGEHAITLANPGTTEFARISLQSAIPNFDTLLVLAPQLRAGILKVNGYGRVRSDTAEVRVQGLDVQGANIERTQIVVNSPSPSPMTFNDVIFTGFEASNTQLEIVTDDDDFLFQNVDFDDIATPGSGGYFVRATDTDAVINFLGITIQGPDVATGLAKSLLIGNATILFQPPS
jgi:hypothetical protein